MEKRVYNFSAGPATMAQAVMEQAQKEFLVYPGAGASIMEISHRSKIFGEVHAKAKNNIKKLLGLSDDYHVLFVPGGATLQFSLIAMNFLQEKARTTSIVAPWSTKAIFEATKLGTARKAWSGKEEGFVRMPVDSELDLDPQAEYVHITSNETIEGVQIQTEPEVGGKPLICDASSDFLSRPIQSDKYAMIYAGAQKNVGPSGMAVVILRDDMLAKIPQNLPSLLDYRVLAEKDSLYNTPPTFTIYMVSLATQWLIDTFGTLEKVAEFNEKKAALIYDAIDASDGFYKGHAQKAYRSKMNISFNLPSEELEAKFISESGAAGLAALKGHRSVGGCRASIYNAMPLEGCQALREFMLAFQKNNG